MIGKLHKNILLNIMLCFALLSLSSCKGVRGYMAKPAMLDMTPPPGPPEYQTGYVDGCSTASAENRFNIVASNGSGLYKHPVYNKSSKLYRSMWRSAYIYCALWIPYLDRNNASFFRPSFRMQNKARPGSFRKNLLSGAPPGPPNFRYGWRQGCDSGKAATGKTKHKLAYKFQKDARFIEGDGFNLEFEKGWETAFWYCQRYYDVMEDPSRGSMF